MTEKSLYHCVLLHLQKEITDLVDLELTVSKFWLSFSAVARETIQPVWKTLRTKDLLQLLLWVIKAKVESTLDLFSILQLCFLCEPTEVLDFEYI